ncbi:gliding motility-associated C-terminal domain-containing protein [Chitinophaga niabensis]|uniref:T9SS type B sorting domain-containing protein n=1 Tax=Chitinophaga niabensis TaxID=536979 RepID=UPI0031BA4116
MLKYSSLYLLILLAFTHRAYSQAACSTIGQTPATAFPVCGSQTFIQQSVPICGYRDVPGPACNNTGDFLHKDKNPFWYKFTCYTEGTLGFTITPNDLREDYDWQIWDITGRDPNEVYTNTNLYLTMNWSGEKGLTGASAAGRSLDVCGGLGQDLFSSMASLKKGHEYLLLISHFSNSQSGYKLSFGGGTADITDPVLPALVSSKYDCANFAVGIKLSRKVLCSTLDPDGSDFTFGPGGPAIRSAKGVTCANGFDLDSVILYLDKPLDPGVYTIMAQDGKDANTLLNACSKQLPAGETTGFTVIAALPVGMAKMKILPCAPDQLELEFPDDIRCSAVAADGSDFRLSGPSAVNITSASTTCNANGLTRTVILKLDQRILEAGDYTVTLVTGTDGNTIASNCHVETLPGGEALFSIAAQPPVLLRGIASPGCAPVAVKLGLSIPVRCSSIAADGSDFMINGPIPVTITNATGICNANGFTDTVILKFSAPIFTMGSFQVQTATGTDGNTLQGECWQAAAVAQASGFNTADTVNSDFTFSLQFNCKLTTAGFVHDGSNHVNSWKWTMPDGEIRREQRPVKVFDSFGNKLVQLEVSNGVCHAKVATSILITSELEAVFSVAPGPYCPMEIVKPVNESTGNILTWEWDYGNGTTSMGEQPLSMRYFPQSKEQDYRIRLIVRNNVNCRDTMDRYIKAARSCYIDVPSAFSPNHDGQNDYFYPLNAYKAQDLKFQVYNRLGQLMFESGDWRKRWDGCHNGIPVGMGTYAWMLEYTDGESGKKVFRKGTVVLVR